MNFFKRKEKVFRHRFQNNTNMTSKTRDFIQKVCYRKTASVDMTRYGFINDSKVHPVNLLLKPLRQQLVKICAKVVHSSKKPSPVKGISSPKSRRIIKHNKRKKPRKEVKNTKKILMQCMKSKK